MSLVAVSPPARVVVRATGSHPFRRGIRRAPCRFQELLRRDEDPHDETGRAHEPSHRSKQRGIVVHDSDEPAADVGISGYYRTGPDMARHYTQTLSSVIRPWS